LQLLEPHKAQLAAQPAIQAAQLAVRLCMRKYVTHPVMWALASSIIRARLTARLRVIRPARLMAGVTAATPPAGTARSAVELSEVANHLLKK
jgi:hypothetical protein